MSWNYRLVRHHYLDQNDDVVSFLAVHEVYYEDDGTTPRAYSEEPVKLEQDVTDGDEDAAIMAITTAIDTIRDAVTRPILDEEDF